jgi:hypothetical protein
LEWGVKGLNPNDKIEDLYIESPPSIEFWKDRRINSREAFKAKGQRRIRVMSHEFPPAAARGIL